MPLCASIWRSFSCRRSRIGRRAIILFEGPEGSGKKYALKQLAAAFDPCHCAVHSIGFDRREASEGHWLARFWRCLPGASRTAIFYRSWYLRVLDDRIPGRIDENMVARAFDEINEFEAQQRDYGTLIVKLYFEVAPKFRNSAWRGARPIPWSHGMRRDEPIATDDPGYRRAFEALKANSDTRWSPWLMIDGNDEEQAAPSPPLAPSPTPGPRPCRPSRRISSRPPVRA